MKLATRILPPFAAAIVLLAATVPVIAADATTGTTGNAATTGDVAAPKPRLQGGVSEYVSPIIEDAPPQVVPEGTSVNLTLNTTVNSEVSQVGDQVVGAVSMDVKDKDKVVLPGQWFVLGKVTRVEGQRRLGRNGYVEVKFDKLVSPDGKYVIPVDASVSTGESTAKTVAKHLVTDTRMVSQGAVGGALMSVQLTGIPLAVASHGYSVAIGAGAGATIGLIAALWRKGKISTNFTGEAAKFRVVAPISLPTFNPNALPSAEPEPNKLANLDIVVKKARFQPDQYGDKRSRLLRVEFALDNRTNKEFSLANLVVMSDTKVLYYPSLGMTNIAMRSKKVSPNTSEQAAMTFDVASPKHKYWLVLLDQGNSTEVTRVPVN